MRHITVILIALILSSFSFSNIHTSNIVKKNKWMSGKIIKESFVDKGGREHPNIQEFYFVCFEKQFFIKTTGITFAGNLSDYVNTYVRIHASVESGLWDTDDPNVQSRIGDYLIINHIEKVDIPEKLIFTDQNNNSYIITDSFLQYNPVEIKESSSGIYSGGVPREITITTDDFMNIYFLSEKALNNHQLHLIKRIKTSSVVTVSFKNEEISAIIIDSPEIQELQSFIKVLLEI
jgi:hypothetical protein